MKKQHIQTIRLILGGSISMLLFACINVPNPYDDISKSRIIVTERSPLKNGDTVTIDEKNTLELAVELFEFIESFTIHNSNGASWSDTTVQVNDAMRNPITFDITFIIEGMHTIEITTYYTDGSTALQTITIYTSLVGDITGPLISIVYDNLYRDTVFTDTIPFTLNARIQDTESDLDTSTFRINGKRFETVNLNNTRDSYTYYRFIQDDFITQPIQVVIVAEDVFTNSRTDTFWIRQNEIVLDSTVTIVRQNPNDDTVTTTIDSITLSGIVDSISREGDFYELRIYINDSLLNIANYLSKSSNSWFFGCKISEEWNTVLLVVYPKEDDLLKYPLDSNMLIVHYQSARVIDESWLIQSNNNMRTLLYTRSLYAIKKEDETRSIQR